MEKKMNVRDQMMVATARQLRRVRAQRRARPWVTRHFKNARHARMAAFHKGE